MSLLLKYYARHIGWILGAFGLLFFRAQCDLALPQYMSDIVSNGVAVSDTAYILQTGGIMLLVSMLGVAADIGVGFVAARLGSSLARDLRVSIFSKVSTFSSAEFDRFSTSSLITRNTNDVTQVLMFSIMLVRMIFYAPIMGFGGAIKCLTMSGDMPMMAMAICIALAILISVIVFLLLFVQPKFTKIQKMVDDTNLVAREGLSGMMVVRAFNTQQYEQQRFDAVNRRLTSTNLFVNRMMALLPAFMPCVMNGLSLSIVWIAAISAQNVTDVANMMAFIQYATHIIMSFMVISMIFIMMPRAIVSANRIGEVLKTEVLVQDRPDAVDAGQLTGVIQFEDVTFRYPGGGDVALRNINFTARPGETVAFIGSTGAGKSTLINLIPRLYDVTEGRITIDGVDLRDFTKESLRRNIGFVPQKNILFSGTIASNLKYGLGVDESADPAADDQAMKHAAEVAQATEFIHSRPATYDEAVAQSGANVSGGQKQRLAIARALARKCPIYIFDDSFSALDFKTDALLRRALKKDTADATVLIVAQRVGTIMGADRIIVLDQGEIVGMGTHGELMKNCPIYADIAHSQLSEEEMA